MPKKFRRNDETLSVLLPGDLKRELKALSYMWGDDGRMSHTVRRIFMDYIESQKKAWKEESPAKLQEYNDVLENLLLAENIEKQEKLDKLSGELSPEELSE